MRSGCIVIAFEIIPCHDLSENRYTLFQIMRSGALRARELVPSPSIAIMVKQKGTTSMRPGKVLSALVVLVSAAMFTSSAIAQNAPKEAAAPTPDNAIMLTIFFKHDQSRPLAELNAQLEKQGFYKAFPPEGVEVVSWYVMMGIGQVVTLRLPASRLREVNRVIETSAWGSYHTEFYPTYDYKAIGIANHEKAK
jgi:hypothetical protein